MFGVLCFLHFLLFLHVFVLFMLFYVFYVFFAFYSFYPFYSFCTFYAFCAFFTLFVHVKSRKKKRKRFKIVLIPSFTILLLTSLIFQRINLWIKVADFRENPYGSNIGRRMEKFSKSNAFDRSIRNTPMWYPLSKSFFHFSSIFIGQCCVLPFLRKSVKTSEK